MFGIHVRTPAFAVLPGERVKVGGRKMTVVRNHSSWVVDGQRIITLHYIDNDATLHEVTMTVPDMLPINVF